MIEYISSDQEVLSRNLEKLPLYIRTLIYLASGASMIANEWVMRQFAETGRFSLPVTGFDEEFSGYSEEMVS